MFGVTSDTKLISDASEFHIQFITIKEIFFRIFILSDNLMKSRYQSTLGNKRVELFDMGAGASEPMADDNAQVASG